MQIIISPAKKMRVDTDSLSWRGLPDFLDKTGQILSVLREMDYTQLKALWKCSDAIAKQNFERIRDMDLRQGLTPAILAYEGIQYQYMAPGVFSFDEFEYVEEHLRILSGFYGMLRPFDGVVPYRLEMQAKLNVSGEKDLYSYWGSQIADRLFAETELVIDLASKEYSDCIVKFKPAGARIINCVFGEYKDGKIIEKGTMCKMARGEMVRYMAVNAVKTAEELMNFCGLGYAFAPEYSSESRLVFLK